MQAAHAHACGGRHWQGGRPGPRIFRPRSHFDQSHRSTRCVCVCTCHSIRSIICTQQFCAVSSVQHVHARAHVIMLCMLHIMHTPHAASPPDRLPASHVLSPDCMAFTIITCRSAARCLCRPAAAGGGAAYTMYMPSSIATSDALSKLI